MTEETGQEVAIASLDKQTPKHIIDNPDFIGNFIEQGLSIDSRWDEYWPSMLSKETNPQKAVHYSRNQELIETTVSVLDGRAPQTGRLTIRQRCTRLIDLLGATNSMLGAQDTLLLTVARFYQSDPTTDKDSLESSAVAKQGFLAFLSAMQSTDQESNLEARKSFIRNNVEDQYVVASTVQEISNAYRAQDTDQSSKLADYFENSALRLYETMITATRNPDKYLLPQMIAAEAHIADIKFRKILEDTNDASMLETYRSQLKTSMNRLLHVITTMPDANVVSKVNTGVIYEAYMPLIVRYFALLHDRTRDVVVRRAMPREDDPRDGMLHPNNVEQLERFSNDLVLEFPHVVGADKRYYVQLKTSTDAILEQRGNDYHPGICEYNAHSNEKDLRKHFIETIQAMIASLDGQELTSTDKRRINSEYYRTSSLFPWEIE